MDEASLHGVECRMIRRLVDRVSTDVFRDRVGLVVKIQDMIIQSRLQWHGHVMSGEINSKIDEVMELEITGKRKKSRLGKSWEQCIRTIWNDMAGEERIRTIERNGERKLKQKLTTPTSQDNGIKTDVVVVVEYVR